MITVKEVAGKSDLKEFVKFPNRLYKDNPCYVPQLESMDYDALDPKVNRAFEVCEAKYFLALDEKGRTVGRVAGIINHAYNEAVGEKVCRFGWIDFVEDEQVAKALIDAVEEYAAQKGMKVMNGPVGFLEFDAAGVLVEGFDKIPTAYGKYNAPYYDRMITALGYEKDVDWLEYIVDLSNYSNEKNHRISKIVNERYGLRQAVLKSREDILKYADGAFEVMNRCYAGIHGYTQLTPGQLEDLKKQFIPNANPDLVSIILDRDDKVVAFSFWLPSLAKALQKAGGSLFPFGWFHILRSLRHNDTVNSLLIAVDEEYRQKGVNAMFFDKIWHGVKKIGIKYIETTRQLESNSDVLNLSDKYPRTLVKRARSYKKSL